jgi:hypothetical protein
MAPVLQFGSFAEALDGEPRLISRIAFPLTGVGCQKIERDDLVLIG